MKIFKKIEISEIQAAQYGKDEEANEFVKLCAPDYRGKVRVVPGDLLGTPKDAFKAVETASGLVKIQEGDWVVKKDDQIAVIPDGVFKLMFAEV
jgi:hypothetical protein